MPWHCSSIKEVQSCQVRLRTHHYPIYTPQPTYENTCPLIFSSPAFFSLPQPHHVTASNPSPGDTPPERGSAVRRKTGTKQKWPRETLSYGPGLSSHSYLLISVVQPPQSSLCCTRSPLHHPSNLTFVNPVLARHLHPPSTSLQPYGKGKVFYGPEPPSGEPTTTECEVNYQLLAVIY